MLNETQTFSTTEKQHHKQQELCKTRPAYRQGRNLTAVKVYSVNTESQHLYIYGVPQINLRNELKNLCIKYGKINNIHVVVDHETELFTEVYHVQYERIQSARIAKRLLDNKSFYGGILHVCYSPECETLEETREKLAQRVKDVTNRIGNNDSQALLNVGSKSEVKLEEFVKTTKSQLKKKRKHGDGTLNDREKAGCSRNKYLKSNNDYVVQSESND